MISVAQPILAGNERAYVLECLNSTRLSSGQFVDRFEQAFARYCDVADAIACCNGTAALHLALAALGVGPGDEVIVPTLTFVATANAVAYCGATPVLADVDPANWCLDPEQVERLITPRTVGIIAVHLYGHPADMDALNDIAERHNLFVLEDAAEAHGARYKGRVAGSLGRAGCFSFFGNKILTMGEGGAVVTGDAALAERMRTLRGQGVDPERRYWFPTRGYNYRLTDLQAAVGLGQVERANWHTRARDRVASWYADELRGHDLLTLQPESPWAMSAHWMNTVLLPVGVSRDEVMLKLAQAGVETRPVFYPMHQLPMYWQPDERFPAATDIAARGINLPSHAALSREDVAHICRTLRNVVETYEWTPVW